MHRTVGLICLLIACGESPPQERQAGPGEDFALDDGVRVLSPTNGETVEPTFTLRYSAGVDIESARLELEGATLTTLPGSGEHLEVITLLPGRADLRLIGVGADGTDLSEHSLTVTVESAVAAPWVTLTSPADGAEVPNPVRFTVEADSDVERIEVLADDWLLGTVAPGEVLTYTFEGTDYSRHIVARGVADGHVVAEDSIDITPLPAGAPTESDFPAVITSILEQYPVDGSYDYYWPSDGSWGGNPHDIYYLGDLFSAGDSELRSYCVGLTFEVFMRAFAEIDGETGGDGHLNGIEFEELYDFRTDWYVRELYGAGIVDAMDIYGVGDRVTDWEDARPGDVVQFWRHSGSGHNNIFIDWERDSDDAIIGLTYWSTQGSTDGIGYNDEYFGSSGSSIDPNHVYIGRPRMPVDWEPWW